MKALDNEKMVELTDLIGESGIEWTHEMVEVAKELVTEYGRSPREVVGNLSRNPGYRPDPAPKTRRTRREIPDTLKGALNEVINLVEELDVAEEERKDWIRVKLKLDEALDLAVTLERQYNEKPKP
ncbi:MAG: hypothetical protein ACLQEQ_05635 [Nitrososphaerales archaeon]